MATRISVVGQREAHLGAGGAGVLANVGQRLLDDAQDLQSRRFVRALASSSRGGTVSSTSRPYWCVKRHRYSRSVGKNGRSAPAAVLAPSRYSRTSTSARKVASARVARALVHLGGLALVEQAPGNAGLQVRAGQHLPQAVVQLARQALAFLQHRQRALLFQEPRLGLALLGDVVAA